MAPGLINFGTGIAFLAWRGRRRGAVRPPGQGQAAQMARTSRRGSSSAQVSAMERRWAVGPYAAATSGSVHGPGGTGAVNRSSPMGGRAYGMPRKPRWTARSALATDRSVDGRDPRMRCARGVRP